MGTRYALTHSAPTTEEISAIHNALLARNQTSRDIDYCLILQPVTINETYPTTYYDTRNGGKWYEHETDIRAVSFLFPSVLFVLQGEGDENGDLWIKYFKGGKCQICRAVITFPPYNPEELR